MTETAILSKRLRAVIAVAACLLLAPGCSRSVEWLDARERGEPLMQKARDREQEGEWEAALRLYRDILNVNPKLALAHLNLAILLHDHRKDYVGAIYHYRRYLELRPETEKRDMIRDRQRLASQLYAAGILRPRADASEPAAPSEEEIALRQENAMLKSRLRQLLLQSARQREEIEALQARSGTAYRGGPDREDEPEAAAGQTDRETQQTYRVVQGDNLSRIAAKVYGDAERWRDIYEANRDRLGSARRIREGQVLVIP